MNDIGEREGKIRGSSSRITFDVLAVQEHIATPASAVNTSLIYAILNARHPPPLAGARESSRRRHAEKTWRAFRARTRRPTGLRAVGVQQGWQRDGTSCSTRHGNRCNYVWKFLIHPDHVTITVPLSARPIARDSRGHSPIIRRSSILDPRAQGFSS